MWGENTELGYKKWWRKSENILKTCVSKIFQLSLTTRHKHWLGRWKHFSSWPSSLCVLSFWMFRPKPPSSGQMLWHPQLIPSVVPPGPGMCVGFEQRSCSVVVHVGQTGDRMNDQKDKCWDCALRTRLLSQAACCVHKGPWFGSQRNPRVWSLFFFL